MNVGERPSTPVEFVPIAWASLIEDLGLGSFVERVIEGARELRKRLTKLGFTPFVKTTGGKGLHVVITIKGADWKEAKAFAKAVATVARLEESWDLGGR